MRSDSGAKRRVTSTSSLLRRARRLAATDAHGDCQWRLLCPSARGLCGSDSDRVLSMPRMRAKFERRFSGSAEWSRPRECRDGISLPARFRKALVVARSSASPLSAAAATVGPLGSEASRDGVESRASNAASHSLLHAWPIRKKARSGRENLLGFAFQHFDHEHFRLLAVTDSA